MKRCASTDCTSDATTLIAYPWSEETPACDVHVGVARKMMADLGRSHELRLLPLPDEPPPTPRDGQPVAGDRRLELLGAQHRSIELELELEKLRHARVLAELELVNAAKDRIADARSLFEHVVFRLVPQIVEAVRGETTVVEGEPAGPEQLQDPSQFQV